MKLSGDRLEVVSQKNAELIFNVEWQKLWLRTKKKNYFYVMKSLSPKLNSVCIRDTPKSI